jgi:hypothetical protein
MSVVTSKLSCIIDPVWSVGLGRLASPGQRRGLDVCHMGSGRGIIHLSRGQAIHIRSGKGFLLKSCPHRHAMRFDRRPASPVCGHLHTAVEFDCIEKFRRTA